MSDITITEQEYQEIRENLIEATVMLKVLYHLLPEDGSSVEVPFEVIYNTDTTVDAVVNGDRRVIEVKRGAVTATDPGPLFVEQLSLPFEEV